MARQKDRHQLCRSLPGSSDSSLDPPIAKGRPRAASSLSIHSASSGNGPEIVLHHASVTCDIATQRPGTKPKWSRVVMSPSYNYPLVLCKSPTRRSKPVSPSSGTFIPFQSSADNKGGCGDDVVQYCYKVGLENFSTKILALEHQPRTQPGILWRSRSTLANVWLKEMNFVLTFLTACKRFIIHE